ncbi:MAG TPA: UDP-N-acetylglucosamine--N-acetylmuramyl-(pentapeptide) pyrophosphoryl-undecaprenol N-acetylglucosamine transferase [Tepidisphaeraceae bacterium]|nr:UDP-N-acetylglucosamine--N-acetylmuramyl-(pentapeptide) pyrophosphoryl-undecaprenol N-acetylglucosamine transferase [Tepidisphaeraceae bacterium]
MPEPTTIFLAGGGTGGHLYPGIAVAEALRRSLPDCRPIFLCTQKEIDRVILEAAGFEFVPQPVVPLARNIGGLLKFWSSWRETKDLVRQKLREHKPAAVIGLGGYAAGVAVKVAALRNTPTAILNPDVIPGRANQYLMRYTRHVCCQFPQSAEHVSKEHRAKIAVTGCPIRGDIVNLPPRTEAAARLGLEPRLSTLVITGASLGAQTINEAVLEMLRDLKLQGWQVLHLAGRDHALSVRGGYRELNLEGLARVIDFTPAMADVWAVSDLCISRSGASSCAELTACGVGSILLPYPYHKDMHQRANAKVLADAGAAVLVDDEKDRRKNAAKLRGVLESLLYDATRRQQMAAAARALGHPNAAQAVAAIVMEMTAAAGR